MTDTSYDRNGHPAANGLFWLAAPEDADGTGASGLPLATAAVGIPVAATVAWSLLSGSGVPSAGQPSTVLLAVVVLLASIGALYSGWRIAAGITG